MARQKKEDGYDEAAISFRASSPITKAVIRYLLGKTDSMMSGREGKSRGVNALLSFWKPYAVKALWRHQKVASSPEDLQQIARDCIEELLRHAQRISDDFGLGFSPDFADQHLPDVKSPSTPALRSSRSKTKTPQKDTPRTAFWITHLNELDDIAPVSDDAFADLEDVMGGLM